MKKVLLLLSCMIVLSGCEFGRKMLNTPTKQVEIFLTKYQMLDEEVMKDLNYVVAEEELFNTTQRETYKKIMKKHYQSLIYHVKDEMVDGDRATVEVELEVTDYSKILSDAESYRQTHEEEFYDDGGVFDLAKYTEYRLEKLKDANSTVTYTIEFDLTKIEGSWQMDPIPSITEQKINGAYRY